MPLSAVDVISPAFQHAKQQLLEPFRFGQWARLALVGLLAGELSGTGGCNSSFNLPAPTHSGGPQRFLQAALPKMDPAMLGGLVLVLILAVLVLGVLFTYLSSVFCFILFDSVLARQCEIGKGWQRRQGPGFQLFVFRIVFALALILAMAVVIGGPLVMAAAAGLFKNPGQHLAALVLGGIALFFLLLAFLCLGLLVHLLIKDFVVPLMAVESLGVLAAWRRLLAMMKSEKGGYAGYIGMKIVLAIGAGILFGIAIFIVLLIFLIPVGGLGAVAVLAGKAAGLKWDVYTITLAIVVGSGALAALLYLIALVSVPATVFFPAYAIYFFAARYPALDAILHPAPPAPLPPPLPLEPSPIG